MNKVVLGIGGYPMDTETFECYEWGEFVTMYNDANSQLSTLRAEVERLRHALTETRDLLQDQRPHAALEWITKSLQGGDHE